MKKLIAILVVFALAMGAAFAEISVSGAVFGTVVLFGSDTSDATDGEIFGAGGMNRARILVSGQDDDGTFGGMVRLDQGNLNSTFAWWKPIDQLLVRIGYFEDGFFGKEGVTGWGFYQTATDVGVTFQGENAFGWSLDTDWPSVTGFGSDFKTRHIFYGGFDSQGLMLEIKPMEMLGINVALPYPLKGYNKYEDAALVEDIFGGAVVQFDLNLDFGNIAITYVGDPSKTPDDKKVTNGQLFAYAGIPIGDNVALDVGATFILPGEEKGHPIGLGAGAKIGITETFGLKARLAVALGGDKEKEAGLMGTTMVMADVLPYFAVNDIVTVFVSVGLVAGIPHADYSDAKVSTAFHFNPYVTIGSEWGPKFLAGLKVHQMFANDGKIDGEDAPIYWSVPIAIQASF